MRTGFCSRWVPVAVLLGVCFAVSAASAESSAPPQDGAGKAPRWLPEAAKRHQEAAMKRYAAQDKILAAARADASAGRYDAAIERYSSVLAELELETSSVDSWIAQSRFREVERELRKLRAFWCAEKIRLARDKYAAGQYNEAIQLATEAQALDDSKKAEVEKLLKDCRGELRNTEHRNEVSISKVDPAYALQEKKIRRYLEEARNYYKARHYDDALKCVENIYKLNPFQPEAIELAGRIYQKFYSFGFARHRADTEALVGYAEWQWVEPIFLRDNTQNEVAPGLTKTANDTDSTSARLDQIIFPQIDFEQTDFPAVLEVLNRNKDYDPEKKGIWVNSNLGAGASAGQVGGKKLDITLKMTHVSLRDLLDYICLMTGMKYAIHSNEVLIGFEGQVNDLVSEPFKIHPNLLRLISKEGESTGGGSGGGGEEEGGGAAAPAAAASADSKESGGGSGGSGGLFTTESASDGGVTAAVAQKKLSVTTAKLKPFFEKYGVKFPANSSITYNKQSGHLVLYNTRENIWLMKEIMREFDALEKCMVMVELKNLSISDKDAQELGFYWSLGALGNGNMTETGQLVDSEKDGWYAGVGKNAQYTQGATPGSFSMLRADVSGAMPTLVNNLELFPALFGSCNPFGSAYDLNLSLSITALNQSGRSEVMSAPKVLTNSGEQAKVSMTKTYYFPESWDTMEFEAESNETSTYFSVTPPIPDFGDSEDIGILFDVTPTIQGDNKTIRLNINSTVTTYVGPDPWPTGITGVAYKTVFVDGNPKTTEEKFEYLFSIWRPIIKRQVFEMQVDVYDGETVVLGGQVDNQTQARVDKVPILGDLPLIGRFFQTRSENSTHMNVLLFVTARRVGNDGMPLQGNAFGAPDFKR